MLFVCRCLLILLFVCSDVGYGTGDTVGVLIELPKRSSSK